jgi:hypothetical protein
MLQRYLGLRLLMLQCCLRVTPLLPLHNLVVFWWVFCSIAMLLTAVVAALAIAMLSMVRVTPCFNAAYSCWCCVCHQLFLLVVMLPTGNTALAISGFFDAAYSCRCRACYRDVVRCFCCWVFVVGCWVFVVFVVFVVGWVWVFVAASLLCCNAAYG